ncbi:MAG: trehalase family glycosidase [Alistipes sp.]|nr:trehalase family glycosidase [Alistipes sp.]
MFKPFLAQIAELGSRQTGDYTWLEERADRGQRQIGAAFSQISYYEQLILAVDYWFRHCDFDQNGLAVWNSSDHSGMENQISRAGGLDAFRYEGVDVNCYLYRELKALQNIALHLHKKEDAVRFGQRADLLADKINTLLWDETEGMYFDRDEYTGRRVKVKAVSAFTPLWAGIASERRAARLVKEHLLNPEEFWTPFPVAGYAQTEPDYAQGDIRDWGCNWRGTTWIPMNYMIMHGLMDYGYTQEAQTLAKKTFELVGMKNEVTREFYQGESGEGLGLKRFWGWSALAYMMPFECALAYDPSRLDDRQIEALGTRLFQIQFPEVKDAPVINTQLTLE